MSRQITKTYNIGTAKDDRLCGTCRFRWKSLLERDGEGHECLLFAWLLRCDKDGKPLRCKPCRNNDPALKRQEEKS